MGLSDKDTIETAALGRPFQLGMLYDCRKDALLQGRTLWDQGQLQKSTKFQLQNNTELNVTTSDLIEEKSDSLKISGSLRLSLLGGLLNVEGSAKYFQDHQSQQVRVTLQYNTTTNFKHLSVSDLANEQVSHPGVFEEDSATHVVTAILYGAGAYFVFDHQSSSKDDKKQVEGEVKLLTDKLKVLAANADASLSMDEKEKAAVEKFSCTLHGDFKLPSNPTSFSEAVSIFRNLPNMLGEKGDQAVPVRVWLYPLVRLDSRAATLQREISSALITRTSEVIESFNHTELKCRALLEDKAAIFPFIEKQVQDLIQMCHQYKQGFIQKLGSVVPSIRGGEKVESALVDILDAHDKSPFSSQYLDEWLETKRKELHMLKCIRKQLEKLDTQMDEDLDDLLFDPDVKNVVCFSFPSVDQPDRALIKMSNHLKPTAVKDISGESTEAKNINCPSSDTRQTIRKQLELFKELKKLSNSNDTKFTAASKHDGSRPGVCILIYEDGSDNAVCFVPPSRPATPTATPVSRDSITVRVTEPDSANVEYTVEYRRKGKEDSEWACYPLEKNQDTVTLSGLEPDINYEIRARAVGKLSYTVSSDVCTTVILTTVGPPTDVKQTEVKTNSVTLTWSTPSVQHCESFKGYIIEFLEDNSHQWQSRETKAEVYTFTLSDLKLNTEYSIRMRTDVGVGVSLPGEEFKIKTKKQQVDKKQLTLLSDDPPVYGLKLKAARNVQFNKMIFGREPTNNASRKTIMVVGATGSGKTTLINGMINYVLGVEWEDNYRFKLINEETNKTQAWSQTSEVTAYQIYHTDGFKVPYSLTIIDTPGFGDTRGIKEDQKITDKIREFFSVEGGVDSIDAVCFVVQSALARLTHTQKYIFDAILSIFGKDIASNIIALVTFADGKSPPVLEAIKEAQIPCATNEDKSILHFKFNNSVLFAKNTSGKVDENNFDHMFWKMGTASMQTFFDHLTNMKAQSLTLTKEVLQERNELEVVVVGVQPMIRKGLSKLEEINTTKAALQNHETHIKENEDFEYEVEVEKSERIDIPVGKFITNCHKCNYTCHYPCAIPSDSGKIGCAAMTNGNCRVCPNKCVWSVHFNMRYRWDIKRVKEMRTYQELKSKYEAAVGEKMNSEKMIKHLEIEYEQVQEIVVEMMGTLTKCLRRLSEIALRPDPLATPDYIDLLIQTEEHEAKPGFKQRIAELHSVRERAVLLTKLTEGVPLTEPEKSTLKKMKAAVKGLFNNTLTWIGLR